MKRFLSWTDRAWLDLTPRQIAQFKAYLQGQNLSKNSVNRALTALMSFFEWFRAAYPEQIAHDPTTAVEMERVPLPPARDLSEIEIAALYLALEERGEPLLVRGEDGREIIFDDEDRVRWEDENDIHEDRQRRKVIQIADDLPWMALLHEWGLRMGDVIGLKYYQ